MTLPELCRQYKVSRQTVHNWLRAGLRGTQDERHAWHFTEQDVATFTSTLRGGPRRHAGKGRAPNPAQMPYPATPPPESPRIAPAAAPANPPLSPMVEPEDTLPKRLAQADRIAHQLWAQLQQVRAQGGDANLGEIALAQKTWLEAAEAREKLAKLLDERMIRRGEWIDAKLVYAEAGHICSIARGAILGLPSRCALACQALLAKPEDVLKIQEYMAGEIKMILTDLENSLRKNN